MSLSTQKESVGIGFGSAHVEDTLEIPPDPIGVVLFAQHLMRIAQIHSGTIS